MSMWTIFKPRPDRLREFDSLMLRSQFVSAFWSVIKERRKTQKLTLQQIAGQLGTNKSAVSRWFGDEPPNWRVSTISEMAHVLDVDIRIEIHDRKTGVVHTASGVTRRPTFARQTAQNPPEAGSSASPAPANAHANRRDMSIEQRAVFG